MISNRQASLARQLALLAHRGKRKRMALSANDALVQVSLPLVLILAIATRLMTLGHTMASMENQAPAVLDLWKQQLILRMEAVLDRWESQSGIQTFSDVQRVQWNGPWPDDPAFQTYCQAGGELSDLPSFSRRLYGEALRYQPPGAGAEAQASFWNLYDPEVSVEKPEKELPAEFMIDSDRREFALRYIEERSRKWKSRVEETQWQVLQQVLDVLPVNDPVSDRNPSAQMHKLASEMQQRGYPLLPAVANEFGPLENP
jgi:hypothetical protein